MRKTQSAVELTEDERAPLRTLLGRGEAPARRLIHARILPKANQGEGGPGWSDAAIADALDVHPDTVARASGVRACRSAPTCCAISTSMIASASTRTPSRSTSGSGSALRTSSANALLTASAIASVLHVKVVSTSTTTTRRPTSSSLVGPIYTLLSRLPRGYRSQAGARLRRGLTMREPLSFYLEQRYPSRSRRRDSFWPSPIFQGA